MTTKQVIKRLFKVAISTMIMVLVFSVLFQVVIPSIQSGQATESMEMITETAMETGANITESIGASTGIIRDDDETGTVYSVDAVEDGNDGIVDFIPQLPELMPDTTESKPDSEPVTEESSPVRAVQPPTSIQQQQQQALTPDNLPADSVPANARSGTVTSTPGSNTISINGERYRLSMIQAAPQHDRSGLSADELCHNSVCLAPAVGGKIDSVIRSTCPAGTTVAYVVDEGLSTRNSSSEDDDPYVKVWCYGHNSHIHHHHNGNSGYMWSLNAMILAGDPSIVDKSHCRASDFRGGVFGQLGC